MVRRRHIQNDKLTGFETTSLIVREVCKFDDCFIHLHRQIDRCMRLVLNKLKICIFYSIPSIAKSSVQDINTNIYTGFKWRVIRIVSNA